MDIGGFAFCEYNLQKGYEWQNWTIEQRIDAAFDKMIEQGITGCRVGVHWDKSQCSSEVVLGKNPAPAGVFCFEEAHLWSYAHPSPREGPVSSPE